MNTLSWIIYLAEVVGGLREGVSYTFSMISFFFGAGITVWYIIFTIDSNCEFSGDVSPPPKGLLRFWFFCLFLSFVSLLIPSREVLYLIAASEIGETVIISDTGQEMLNKVKQIIDLKLQEMGADQL